jgi:uncharacterized membrane protein
MTRRAAYIGASLVFWAIALWFFYSLNQQTASQCKINEARSGLWAECYGFAALVYLVVFCTLVVIDLVRLVIALSRDGSSKE